jgi:hypothetical protein
LRRPATVGVNFVLASFIVPKDNDGATSGTGRGGSKIHGFAIACCSRGDFDENGKKCKWIYKTQKSILGKIYFFVF